MSKPDWLTPELEARIRETIQMLKDSQNQPVKLAWYEGIIIPIVIALLILGILIIGPLLNWW